MLLVMMYIKLHVKIRTYPNKAQPNKAKKKKLLYWRNPTDPKIRPDPTFFFFFKPKKFLFWL